MGIHISVYRYEGDKMLGDVSMDDWDFVRHVGDRDFVSEVLANTEISHRMTDDDFGDRFRPKDFDAWRAWDAKQDVNNGRWAGLTNLLESDADLWVHVSY